MIKSDYVNIKLTEVDGNSKFTWFFMWTTHEQHNYIQKHQFHICLESRVYTWLYLYSTHTNHTHLYIHTYIYIYTYQLRAFIETSAIVESNLQMPTRSLCVSNHSSTSLFWRGLKQLRVIGTSSRMAYFLRHGKLLAAPMQYALQLGADIPTAVWWQPEYEDTLHGPKNAWSIPSLRRSTLFATKFWTNTTTTTSSAWAILKNGLHNIVQQPSNQIWSSTPQFEADFTLVTSDRDIPIYVG